MLDTKKILAENLTALLDSRPDISRLNLSRQIKIADGTLGRIKYGTGNPTVEVLDQIAKFFKVESWQLLHPGLGKEFLTKTPVVVGDKTISGGAARNVRIAAGGGLETLLAQAIEGVIQQVIDAEREKWEQEQRKAG